MKIYKVTLQNRETKNYTLVFIKAETPEIAHDCAWDRYIRWYDIMQVVSLV